MDLPMGGDKVWEHVLSLTFDSVLFLLLWQKTTIFSHSRVWNVS